MWVRAAENRPGNRSVVHHMALFYMPPGQLEMEPADLLFRTVAAFTPGTPPLMPPDGIARHVPAGSKLVFQMHYTPNGTEQVDQSEVALVFADPQKVKKELSMGVVVNFKLEVPPNEPNYHVDAAESFDEDTLVYAFLPHMHLRGKSFRFTAAYPDGHKEVLLDVPRYDFNWQNVYWLAAAEAPAGRRPTAMCRDLRQFGEQPGQSRSDAKGALGRPDVRRDVRRLVLLGPRGAGFVARRAASHAVGQSSVRGRCSNTGRPKRPQTVQLAGTFNDWNQKSLPMTGPDRDGCVHDEARASRGLPRI